MKNVHNEQSHIFSPGAFNYRFVWLNLFSIKKKDMWLAF